MKLSKIETPLLIALLCIFALACFFLERARPGEDERVLSIRAMDPFMQENKVFRLDTVYPFEWDQVLIANAPGGEEPFFADLRAFDPDFAPLHEGYSLLIFYFEGEVADYLQYAESEGRTLPFFVENHRYEPGWHRRIPAEKALFYCTGVRDGRFLCSLIPELR